MRDPAVVQPAVHVDLVAQVVRVVRVVRVVHLLVPTAQVADLVADLEALEAVLNSSDGEENRSGGDVSKKNCSHKRWRPIPQLTPRSLRARLLSKEAQRLKK